jgi:hypothetical protein
MAGRADAFSLLERLEQVAVGSLYGAAAVAALAAAFLLMFRVPARAVVIFDGAKTHRRHLRGAIISNGVHNAERPIYPWLVEDRVQFQTLEGEEIRATVRRRYSSDAPFLVWYAPANPARATALSPLTCLGYAGFCLATALWLGW